jgi:uncharacterized protein YyaL (SSP411 family)
MESQAQMAAENPFGFGFLLNTIFMYMQKPVEITLLNDSDKEIKNYLEKSFLPESIFVSITKPEQLENLSKHTFFAGKNFDSNKTNVFVCKDFTCSLPLQTINEIKKAIE